MNRATSYAKAKVITAGLYRPARFLVDHLVDRRRLHGHRRRQRFYRQLIGPGDLCFDVGANIGDYTETLNSLGAHVIAAEPQPACIDELRARFAGNDRVTVVPVALGASEGTAQFFLRERSGFAGLVENWEGRRNLGVCSVPVKTLDQLITAYGLPKYIKVDVEGYELQVITGLHAKTSLISFEYHLRQDDCTSKLEIIDALSRLGELQIALVSDGAVEWTVPWMSLEDFLEVFPERITAEMGDIFCRIS